jgi:hypothetical protein
MPIILAENLPLRLLAIFVSPRSQEALGYGSGTLEKALAGRGAKKRAAKNKFRKNQNPIGRVP